MVHEERFGLSGFARCAILSEGRVFLLRFRQAMRVADGVVLRPTTCIKLGRGDLIEIKKENHGSPNR